MGAGHPRIVQVELTDEEMLTALAGWITYGEFRLNGELGTASDGYQTAITIKRLERVSA